MFNIPFHRKVCPNVKKCLTKKHSNKQLRNHRGIDFLEYGGQRGNRTHNQRVAVLRLTIWLFVHKKKRLLLLYVFFDKIITDASHINLI